MYPASDLLGALLMYIQIVLSMSDQQLVTGLAILISGFYQLKHELLFYHWQMITSLAWFLPTHTSQA